MPPATMRRSPRCLAGPADGYSEATALAAAKRACSHTLGSVEDHAPSLSCNRSIRAAGAEPALLHSPPLINAVPRRGRNVPERGGLFKILHVTDTG